MSKTCEGYFFRGLLGRVDDKQLKRYCVNVIEKG